MELMTCLSVRVATGDMSIFDAAEAAWRQIADCISTLIEETAWQTPNMNHEGVLALCQWQQDQHNSSSALFDSC